MKDQLTPKEVKAYADDAGGVQALAEKVGATRQTVYRWINGDVPCRGMSARVVQLAAMVEGGNGGG